jgi:hypothetical protein
MQSRSLIRRLFAGAVLAFSATATATLPIADGYAERTGERVHAHVEKPGSSRCPQVHDHLACQICNALRLFSARSAVQFPIARRQVAIPAALRRLRSVEPTWRSRAASPRAPPLA